MAKVKEFFRGVRDEYKEILHLEECIKYQHLKLLPSAIRYDKDKVQVSQSDTMANTLVTIADQTAKMEALKLELETKRGRAYGMIYTLKNPDEREVMTRYYMEPMTDGKMKTWDDVANEMGYSRRQVLNKHGEALLNLES